MTKSAPSGKGNFLKKLRSMLISHAVWVFPLLGFLYGVTYFQNFGAGLLLAFGGLIVSMIYLFQTLVAKKNEKRSFHGNSYDFDEAFIILIAAVLKTSDYISSDALQLVDLKLKKEYSGGYYQRLQKSLKHKLSLQQPISIEECCTFVHENFSAGEKVLLLHFLVRIAIVDGVLSVTENTVLQQITGKIGVPYRTLDSILSAHRFKDEYQQQQQEYQSQRKVPAINAFENAYKILEITAEATDKEIKKAYKKLAVMHHPDKVAHLGEHHQKAAAEKFKVIVTAYDLICKKRGIV